MRLPGDGQVHYQAAFELHPVAAGDDAMLDAIRLVRSWVKAKEREKGHAEEADALGKGWFFQEGQWQCKGSIVEVRSEIGEGPEQQRQYWALRYDEPCAQERHRRWRTDIGLTRLGDGVAGVALRVGHYMTPGFIGEEPALPVITSPKIVKTLLGDKRWSAHAGTEPLSMKPNAVCLGGVPDLVRRLEDTSRTVPILLVSSLRDEPNEFALDPTKLAWDFAANLSVYSIACEQDVVEEFIYHVPREYRCTNGLIRLYMPGVRFHSESDHRRHRFFTLDDVEQKGTDAIVRMISRGLARTPLPKADRRVLDIDDVSAKRVHRDREFLRNQLKHAASGDDVRALQEWADFLVSENDRIEAELAQARERAEEAELAAESERQEREEQVEQFAYRERRAQARVDRAEAELANASSAATVLEAMDELPRTLDNVLRFVASLYPRSIVVLDDAYESARAWNFDLDKAWRVLRAMAITLGGLHFEGGRHDIPREFREISGFELAMSESKTTKGLREATRERLRIYNGSQIEISHHVKIGTRPPNLLRVHYYADHENKLIVIGHCGDHLRSAATAKRK